MIPIRNEQQKCVTANFDVLKGKREGEDWIYCFCASAYQKTDHDCYRKITLI